MEINRLTSLIQKGILCLFISFSAKTQQKADSIFTALKNTSLAINKFECTHYQPITNRAMNLFMADRVGYYLADSENLTYCKNNLTLNTADGIMSMTHSFFEPSGTDLPINNFTALGLKTNIFNAFQATNNKATYKNELGITYKKYWLSKPKIIAKNCIDKEISAASRAIILKNIGDEIIEESQRFEENLAGQNADDLVVNSLKSNFYTNFAENISRKFATLQFRNFFETMRFKQIKMHWTSASFYLPVILQKFTVSADLNGNFSTKKSFPAEFSISHTRFTEWHNESKFYFNMRAAINLNNSASANIIQENTVEHMLNLGLKNSSYLLEKQLNRAYLGNFTNFLTPSLKAQLIYFPPQNHFGISASLMQNFGKFKALNGTLGIPVVLIDKQSEAHTNFEIQVHYFDLANTKNTSRSLKENVSIGVSFGQPIGRRVY